ncbi:hypothetical protein J3E69DRAFT_345810 [Trichoderma sp. SZMC 28015]
MPLQSTTTPATAALVIGLSLSVCLYLSERLSTLHQQNSTASSWTACCHHLMQMATNLNHLASCVLRPSATSPGYRAKRHLVLLTCITPVRPSANTVPTPKSLKKKFACPLKGRSNSPLDRMKARDKKRA